MNSYPGSDLNPETDEESLSRARKIVYGEVAFAIFPFVVTLILIGLGYKAWSALVYTSDWSLAASLLAGQLIVRYSSAMSKSRGRTRDEAIILRQTLFVCLVALCWITFGLYNALHDPLNSGPYLAIWQFLLFIYVIYVFIIQGSAAQWINDIPSNFRKPEANHSAHRNNVNETFTEEDYKMARRIACAAISIRFRVPYQTAMKQYMPRGVDIGQYWLSIAKQIRQDMPKQPQ